MAFDPSSQAYRIYGRKEVEEEFQCSYGLNPNFQPLFERSALRIVGTGDEGEARVVELQGADFFIGTLFMPQLRPLDAGPHPLIRAFVSEVVRVGAE